MTTTLPAPTPFVRWAGGKRRLLEHLLARRPRRIARYVEPFVGGGALFFALRAEGYRGPALLADTNEELVVTYRVVRDRVRPLLAHLRKMARCHSREFFESAREWRPSELTDLERAGRFIYLNRAGFNGLYRVNRSGGFNVPWGKRAALNVAEDTLRAASAALLGAEVVHGSFADVVHERPGDWIYCDPPYLPASKTASFTAYGAAGFGLLEHRELANFARSWAIGGARVLLSNADVPAALDLYAGDHVIRITAPRVISARGSSRGPAPELLVEWRPR